MKMNGCVPVGNTDMYYVAFGTGEKKLVVLPGLSDGLWTVKGKAWFLAPSYKHFYNEYTVYMFSRKNELPEGYSIKDMADDQAEAMRQLGIDHAYVMGVSQGGMIAQYLAINYPELVERLILVVTAPYANATIQDVVSRWIDMTEHSTHTELMVDTAERVYTKAYMESNKKYLNALARFTKPSNYDRFNKNAKAILEFDVRDELSKIQCPTYIIAGDDDNTVGNEAPYELQRGIPNNEVFIYKGYGHGLFEENKDFYDRVLEYCNREL